MPRPIPLRRFLLIAIGITALHLCLILFFASPGPGTGVKYLSLLQGDSRWYAGIVDQGYSVPASFAVQNSSVTDLSFFPAYPLLTWIARQLLALSTQSLLLILAQLFCIPLWMYVLLFLQRWRVDVFLSITAVLLILAFPSAFFFVTGSPDSLFMAALLGFLYWSTSKRPQSWMFASVHGAMMTAASIAGLPLIFAPLLAAYRRRALGTWRPWATTLCATLGALMFFLYGGLRFGQWNLSVHFPHTLSIVHLALPVFVLLVLAAVKRMMQNKILPLRWAAELLLPMLIMFSALIEFVLVRQFTSGAWVG